MIALMDIEWCRFSVLNANVIDFFPHVFFTQFRVTLYFFSLSLSPRKVILFYFLFFFSGFHELFWRNVNLPRSTSGLNSSSPLVII